MPVTQLLIRLSDERAWSSAPFSASGLDDLRDGSLEAFAALRAEWAIAGQREIPAHQTRNLAQHEALRPHSLIVQVCYHGEWSKTPFTPVIHEPGAVLNARKTWFHEDWADAWARCVRTFEHVNTFGLMANWAARP